jgi:Ser/Thr protein kinase RdoA (MazF antagonist)
MTSQDYGTIRTLHSVVDGGELGAEIKRRWGLDNPFYCELLARGMNDVYLVRSGNARYAARVWRADTQNEGRVTWELEFLRHLKARGIPVIAALPDREGNLSFSVDAPEGRRYVCLFEWAEGRDFALVPTPELSYRVGKAVGEMNVAGLDFAQPCPRPIDFPGAQIRDKFPSLVARLFGRTEDHRFYGDLCEKIAAGLEAAVAEGVPVGPIHGDVHALNIFVREDGSFSLVDFDTCGEAHLVHDAVSFTWANTIFHDNRGMKGLDAAVNDAYMEGYEAARPLSAVERKYLPLFTAAKEFSNMTGMADAGRYVGHLSLNERVFDWYTRSVRRHAEAAGLI